MEVEVSSSLEVERREEGWKGVGGEGGRERGRKGKPFSTVQNLPPQKKRCAVVHHYAVISPLIYEIQITSKAEINSKSKIIRK